MRTTGLVLLAAFAACSSGPRLPRAAQGSPVLEVRGAVKGGPFALGAADVAQLPRARVEGRDPRTGTLAQWEGPSIAALIQRVDIRKGADTAIIRTAEGAAIPVPLTLIRQLAPVLADRADGTRLATPTIAWPNQVQGGLTTDPRAAAWWARNVVAIEVVEWQRTVAPALAPPVGAADAARRGSVIYAESCISCHRMRGFGGERGPELTNMAARLRPGAFASLLSGHPGWADRPPGDASSDAAATELWTFLKAIAHASSAGPSDEHLTADSADPVANTP